MDNGNNSKKCKKCGLSMPINEKKCPHCNAYQDLPILMIILIVIIVALVISLLIVNNKSKTSTNNNYLDNNKNQNVQEDQNPSYEIPNENEPSSQQKTYGFDETFVFDELEINIGSSYSFDILDNRYSDYHNQTVVKLPITVKNISNETHGLNMFSYNIYGSSGIEIDELGSYFDDDVNFAGDLRSGASYTKYLYFLYDGDGEYAIEFDDWSTKVIVEFNITNLN